MGGHVDLPEEQEAMLELSLKCEKERKTHSWTRVEADEQLAIQ
jgi:hypothetical protein